MAGWEIGRVEGLGIEMVPETTGGAVLAFPLIIAPGTYSMDGQSWNFSEEGLHYIFHPIYGGGHRIVFGGDVDALMAAFANLTRAGRSPDESLTLSQLTAEARTRTVTLRCGRLTDWIRATLSGLGYQSRIVRLLTADTPNGFDDGHVAIEVKIGNTWRFYDVATDARFTDGGETLSLASLFDQGLENVDTVDMARSETTPTAYGGFASEVYANLFFRAQGYGWWRERIYQIPGIPWTDGNIYYYLPEGTESRQSWVLGLQSNYRVISKADWLARFY